ncbi:MAG: SDR family NAD(P)-dependent oxidoreductase [Sphingobium sp.]
MSSRFEGKVVVATGVTQGIGEAIARRFVAEGALVVGGARRTEQLEALEKELGDTFVGVAADVTKEADVENMVAQAVQRFGRVDIGMNVAGGAKAGTVVNLTEEDYQSAIDLSLKSVFFGVKHLARQMIAQGEGGAIVNVSSLNSIVPLYGAASYSSSKAAVDMFTKNAALELARHRIRVNALLPGLVKTPATDPFAQSPEIYADFMRKIAYGRPAEVEEMTGPALFLASDDASYVTGSTLLADGGWALTGYPDLSAWFPE